MKKTLLLFALTISMISCLGVKEVTETKSTKSKTHIKSQETDSVSSTKVNKEIRDRVVVNVPKNDNAEVMNAINSVMMQLNTQKFSGHNSYKSDYDKDKGKLTVDFVVGETKETDIKTKENNESEKETEDSFMSETEKTIKRIPFIVWIVVFIIFLPQILTRLTLITSPVSSILKAVIKK